MDELSKQVLTNEQRDVFEFVNNPKYSEIKNAYIDNFSEIKHLIEILNPRLAIESIEKLIGMKISEDDDFLFFVSINSAIKNKLLQF